MPRSGGVRDLLTRLVEGVGLEVVPMTEASAHRTADAHACWGKGVHPAGLNFGDCFAYALARERACRLLYLGDDSARTDALAALPR